MADGVSFQTTTAATPPDATKIATDDAGASGHVQIVKLALSADGSATPITADADGLKVNLGVDNDVTVASLPLPAGAATLAKQDTIIGHVDGIEGLLTTIDADTGAIAGHIGAGGLKVDLGVDNDVTVTGSVTVNAGTNLNTSALALEAGGNLATAVASLSVIDDWDETDRAKVNPIVGQAGVQAGSGAVSVTTQRVVLATDVALPAGTNAIGKLAANSGVDIGDVDVTSLPAIPAGDNAIGRVKITDGTDVALVTAGGLLQVDASGVAVPITDNAGSLTVDGTVTVQDGGNVISVDDAAGSLTVDGSVSLAAALPAGTNNIGDVDVLSLAGTGTNAGTQVTVSNASTTILAARSGRRGAIVVNYQTVDVYIDPAGGTATTSMFKLQPGASLSLPVTSAITGITSAAYTASGDAKIHVVELY